MSANKVILLNGTSSSGKTSIAKVLQDTFTEPYLHVSIDAYLSMVPSRYFGVNPAHDHPSQQGVSYQSVTDDKGAYFRLEAGPYGYHLVLNGFHVLVLALAAHGNNLIVDDMLIKPEFLSDYLRVLQDVEVWFVEVYCPLEVIEQREIARGDRLVGGARGQYEEVYAYKTYDISVDTSLLSPEAVAQQIKTVIDSGRKPNAFVQLRLEASTQA